MISYGNPNIFFANIGRGDVGIAPYKESDKLGFPLLLRINRFTY